MVLGYPNAGAYCLLLRQHPRERIRWLESGSSRLPGVCSSVTGKALRWVIWALPTIDLGEYRRAIEYHEQHLANRRERSATAGRRRALGNLGIAYTAWASTAAPSSITNNTLKSRARSATAGGKAMRWAIWASPTSSLGEYRRAIEYYEQRLQIAREIGDRLRRR